MFSLIEISFISLNNIKISSLVNENKFGADILLDLKKKPNKVIIAVLIGNTVVNFSAVSLATLILTDIIPNHAILISTIVMSFLVLIFGQIVPKVVAQKNAAAIAPILAFPTRIFIKLFFPAIYFCEKISEKVSKGIGSNSSQKVSQDELESMIQISRKDGIIDDKIGEILSNLVKVKDVLLENVMTPKSSVIMLGANQKIKDVMNLALEKDYSRFPVYKDNENNIVGVISMTDLIRAVKSKKTDKVVSSVMHDAFIIPKTKGVLDLLLDFKEKNVHIAIVIDEYGLLLGIVTISDIIQRIFGRTLKEEMVVEKKKAKDFLILKGEVTIEELNKLFSSDIKIEGINTINGFIENSLQRIPVKGEKFEIDGFKIEVKKATAQKIEKIKISRK